MLRCFPKVVENSINWRFREKRHISKIAALGPCHLFSLLFQSRNLCLGEIEAGTERLGAGSRYFHLDTHVVRNSSSWRVNS
jgi:hypothetical protein